MNPYQSPRIPTEHKIRQPPASRPSWLIPWVLSTSLSCIAFGLTAVVLGTVLNFAEAMATGSASTAIILTYGLGSYGMGGAVAAAVVFSFPGIRKVGYKNQLRSLGIAMALFLVSIPAACVTLSNGGRVLNAIKYQEFVPFFGLTLFAAIVFAIPLLGFLLSCHYALPCAKDM
jgi:hypothetical protein